MGRLALRILSVVFAATGQSAKLKQFANASTLDEQQDIYEKNIRPVLVSGVFVKVCLSENMLRQLANFAIYASVPSA